MSKSQELKIAIVHDFLDAYGGAERVLEELVDIFPEAQIYTLLCDYSKLSPKLKKKKIQTSFLQKFPKFIRRRKKWFLPILPTAPETFDLRDFDLVISSSGAWSKGIITRLNTIHVSYMHSPMRFAWDVNGEYLNQQKKGRTMNILANWLLNYIRVWDRVASDRPDFIIANSRYTQKRIKKYYGRESRVIYPPVNQGGSVEHEKNDQKYFLIVSRLSPYKKVDMAIEAFNKLELPLVIVGTGDQEKYLRSIANDNIRFMGWQDEEKLKKIYSGARAFIFSGVDDFGIAPAEAMSFGKPVIALKDGGIEEIVTEGQTGEYFNSATSEVIADAVRRFIEKENDYDRELIKKRAGEFSKERFKEEFKKYIQEIISNGKR